MATRMLISGDGGAGYGSERRSRAIIIDHCFSAGCAAAVERITYN